MITASNDSIKNKNRKRTFSLFEINSNNKDFLNKLDSNKKKEGFYCLNLIRNNLNSTRLEKIMIRKFKREKKKGDNNWISLKEQIDYSDLYIIFIITNIKYVYRTKVSSGWSRQILIQHSLFQLQYLYVQGASRYHYNLIR